MTLHAATALHRFGLGARPGDLARVGDDPRGFLLQQIDANAPLAPIPGLMGSAEGHHIRFAFLGRKKAEAEDRALIKKAFRQAQSSNSRRWIEHVVASPNGFAERLAMFWSNHLHVPDFQKALQPLRGGYENDVIRAHALGRFSDLVHASSDHPAMLIYLDQVRSVGPRSRFGGRRDKGLNENYARELLELHTLGADGGYTQNDVTALAKLLTGWVVRSTLAHPDEAGRASFVANRHEPGPHTVLGRTYDGRPETLKRAVIDDLARHPSTARFIAGKFARAFVPEPASALVERLETSFRDTDGDLRELARTLVKSDEAWTDGDDEVAAFRSPMSWTIAAARGFPARWKAQRLRRTMNLMGQRPWGKPEPDGWSTDGRFWFGPQALEARLKFMAENVSRVRAGSSPQEHGRALFGSALSDATFRTLERSATREQGLTLLAMSPEFMTR